MQEQTVLISDQDYSELDCYFARKNIKRVLLVCDNSISFLKINDYFKTLPAKSGTDVIRFSDFQPNPLYESVVKGTELFRSKRCDAIVAVGGGSAMDVAKCIKLYSAMEPDQNYLFQKPVPNDIELLAIPTTAGTGSEATKYAVIYYNGEKQSITDESCVPGTVFMDAGALKTLPVYQRKVTMLDALCHALESFWSVNSTEESQEYSQQAMVSILSNWDSYLNNEEVGNAGMMMAAHTAGKAINITQTTAGHAMSYKMTSLFGIAHGHAAALCNSALFPYMVENVDKCIDPRGKNYLILTLERIAETMGCAGPKEAAEKFKNIVTGLELEIPVASNEEFAVLRTSVNPVRLKNHPIKIDEGIIDALYHQILREKQKI